MKVALNEKWKKLHGFSFSINIANFEAFLSVFKLTNNLFLWRVKYLTINVLIAFWKIKNLLKWLFPTSILKYGLKIFFKKLCLISFVAILLNNLWAILEVVKTLFRHGQIIYQHQKDKISKVKLAIMQQCA